MFFKLQDDADGCQEFFAGKIMFFIATLIFIIATLIKGVETTQIPVAL
jgi:hypothetical protein